MSALGKLVVSLALEYAQYTKGLDKSDQASLQFARKAQKNFDQATNSLGNMAKGAVGVGAAFLGVNNIMEGLSRSIDDLANLDDLAQKTGSSVENLSKMQKVAKQFGADFGAVDSSISKLAKGLGAVDDASNKTTSALRALGITSEFYRTHDVSDVYIEAAKRLQNYRDDASKTALVIDIMGKAGAENIPYLNDLAENVDKMSGVSAEAAAQAAKFQDQMGFLKLKTDEAFQSISNNFLPGLNEIISKFIDGTKEGGLFVGILEGIGNYTKVFWLGSEATQRKDRMEILTENIKIAGKELEALEAQMNSFGAGRNSLDSGDGTFARKDSSAFNKKRAQVLAMSQELQKLAIEQNKNMASPYVSPNTGKPSVAYTSGEASNSAASAKALANTYDSLISKSRDYVTAMQYESVEGEKLSAGQKLAAELREFLTKNTLGLTKAEIEGVNAAISRVTAEDSLNRAQTDRFERVGVWVEYQMQLNEAQKAHTDGLMQATLAYDGLVTSELDQLKSLEEQLNILKYGKVATQQMESARLLEAAAAFEQNAVYAEQNGVSAENIKSMRDRAQALRDLASARDQVANKQVEIDQLTKIQDFANDTWRSLGDGLTNALFRGFERGETFGKNFFTSMKNLAQTTVLKFATDFVFSPIKAGVAATSMGAAGTASASGNGYGTPGIIGTGKSIFSAITEGFQSANASYFSAIAKFGSTLSSVGLDKLGSLVSANSVIIGKALPYAGAVISLLKGDIKGAALQGIGVAIGTYFGGPIGGAIGGAIGSMVSGMFGSHVSRPKYYANTTVSDAGSSLLNAYTNSDGKKSNTVASGAGNGIGDTIAQYARELDGAVKDFVLGINYQQKYDTYLLSVGNAISKNGMNADVTFKSSGAGDGVANAFLVAVRKGLVTLPEYITELINRSDNGGTAALDNVIAIKSIYESLADLPPVFRSVKYAIDEFANSDSLDFLNKRITAISTYTDLFYSQQEKLDTLQAQLTTRFTDLGNVLPATREGLRALIDGLDTTTLSEYGVFNALVDLAPQLDAYYKALESQADITKQAAAATNEMIDSLLGTDKFSSLTDYLRYKGVAKNYGAAFASDFTSNLSAGLISNDASGKTITATGLNDLVAELQALRSDVKAALLPVAINTSDAAKVLKQFNGAGMPPVRDF